MRVKPLRIAIFSDVHGNIHSLEPTLEQIEAGDYDRVVCCGDLVGYGAFPNEVVEFIEAAEIQTIMGNYDEGVAYDKGDCGCVYKDKGLERAGRLGYLWTTREVTPENKAILRGLPRRLEIAPRKGPKILIVHGSPRAINEYLFENRPESVFRHVSEQVDADILVFGHTHIPFDKTVGKVRFINCGSVGMPKDGDPRACYVSIEIDSGNSASEVGVTFKRVKYDVESAARAIERKGLPPEFADMLRNVGNVEKAVKT